MNSKKVECFSMDGHDGEHLHRWLERKRVRRGSNLVDVRRKVAYDVPLSDWNFFLEMYFRCCESYDYHFSEVSGSVSRLWLEIDTKRSWPGIKVELEQLVNEAFVGEWTCVIGYRDGVNYEPCHNMYIVFAGLIVTKEVRRAFWDMLKEVLCCDLDTGASGHRMPGSYDGTGLKPAYHPLTDCLTMRAQECESVATLIMKPNTTSPFSSKAFYGHMSGTTRKGMVDYPCKDSESAKVIEYIRRRHKNWRRLKVSKARYMGLRGQPLNLFIGVMGLGRKHCINNDKSHTGNNIYFKVLPCGEVQQHCYNKKQCAGCFTTVGQFLQTFD